MNLQTGYATANTCTHPREKLLVKSDSILSAEAASPLRGERISAVCINMQPSGSL